MYGRAILVYALDGVVEVFAEGRCRHGGRDCSYRGLLALMLPPLQACARFDNSLTFVEQPFLAAPVETPVLTGRSAHISSGVSSGCGG